MKYYRSIFLAAIILLSAFKTVAGNTDVFDPRFRLLPQPQKIEVLKSVGLSYSDLRAIYITNTDCLIVLTGLPARLPHTNLQTNGTLSLIIHTGLGLPSPDGYILQVKNKQVTIEAEQQSGLFYGIQTLNQLLDDAHDQQIDIPACRITDYPNIAVRAVHIDLKNHMDAGYYYYNIIDQLAAIKINNITIEFEDKLRYRKAKEVGAANAISVEEFIAISKYAKDRFIEISPLVQGLGHASFILKHDAYKDLRDDPNSDWAFDPLNPKTYELQFSLYEDAIAATPYGKYLHVGGDEVGDLGKSSLSRLSGKSALELQMYWLKKVTDFALAHNRIPVFWDDMVFKLGKLYQTTFDTTLKEQTVSELWGKNKHLLDENIVLFPKNCIYMRWSYETPAAPGNIRAIDWYKSHDLPVMAATSAHEFYVMLQRNKSNFQGIKDFCRITAIKKLHGILCTVWDDSAPHFETTWRALHDFAWFSWNDTDYSEKEAHSTFRQRFFSPALAADSFEVQNMLEEALNFWDTAFIMNGDRENYHASLNFIGLPDQKKNKQWSRQYIERLRHAEETIALYNEIKKRIDRSKVLLRRNRYAIEVLEQINELQVYSSKLLVLIGKYDEATSNEAKEKVLDAIKSYTTEFPFIRQRLEKVYGITRMLDHPEGYKLDMNLHAHFANSTSNTDWMYSYELPMNKKISDWVRSLADR